MGVMSHRNKTGSRFLDILYEDAYLTVVCKPSGLLTVSYPGSTARTVLDILYDMRRKRGLVSKKIHPAVVHRLDRDTSGVLILALSAQSKKRLMDNWGTLVTERRYRALCEIQTDDGFPLPDDGIIDRPLLFNAYHQSYAVNKSKYTGSETPLSAITRYRVLSRNAGYALIECELETGRKNQIRAHLASYELPVAGDVSYRARTNPDNRLCLHARSLVFTHPFTGEKLSFDVPEPPQWALYASTSKEK